MKHTQRIKKSLLLLGAFCSVFLLVAVSRSPLVNAANPTTIPFQGKVVNANGTNVTDGTYSFTFKLYTVSSAGTAIWGETQSSVAVSSGVFQVNLGSTCSLFTTQTCSTFSNTAIDFNANPTLYLGITFNGDAAGEMSPRIQLGSVPYAFNADKVGGLSASQLVQLSPGAQQTGAVNVSGNVTSGATVQGVTVTATGVLGGNSLSINSGTFAVNSTGAITASTGVANSGGYVQSGSTANTLTGSTTFSGGVILSSASVFDMSGSTGTFKTGSGAVTINGATTFSGSNALTVGTGLTSLGGGLTVSAGNFDMSSSAGTFKTGTGAVTINGATTLSGSNALTVGTGLTSLGGGLTVTAGATNVLAITAVGTAQINVTGTAATSIGNSTGAFTLTSPTLNISGGALTGVAGLTFASGNFDMSSSTGTFKTGSGAVTINGPTTLSGSNALTVGTGLTSLGGGLTVSAGNISLGGGAGTFTVNSTNLDITGGAISGVTGYTQATGNFDASASTGNFSTSTGAVALNGSTTISGLNTFTVNSNTSVPTADQVTIDNSSSTGVTTAGVNGLNVHYKGGAAAVEASGMRIDFTPGGTSGGTWSGQRIVESSAAASGVKAYGIKLEGAGTGQSGTDAAVEVASGWDIGLDVQSGGMQLADTSSDPTTPTAGQLRVYSRSTAGRSMLTQKSSSGVSYAFQPSLFQQNVMLVGAGGLSAATTLTSIGAQMTASGTITSTATPTEASGFMNSITTAATASSPGGVYGTNATYYRGSVTNGADGFFYAVRINLTDTTLTDYTNSSTGVRMFFGLSDQSMATMAASNTPTGNYAGFQFAASRDTTGIMQVTSRDGTTQTQTATALTLASSKTYDLYLYMKPRDSTLYFRIDNLTDGTTVSDSTKTTNLPTTTAAMRPMAFIAPLTAVAKSYGFQHMYVESDR